MPVSPRAALALLDRITALPEHGFWPDELPANVAIPPDQLIAAHRQITDAYLLALAAARDGLVATLDRSMVNLAGASGHTVEAVQ